MITRINKSNKKPLPYDTLEEALSSEAQYHRGRGLKDKFNMSYLQIDNEIVLYADCWQGSFSRSLIKNCMIGAGLMKNCKFVHTELTNVLVSDVAFEKCDFSGLLTSSTAFYRCSFQDCKFLDVNMRDLFNTCSFSACDFTDAILNPIQFLSSQRWLISNMPSDLTGELMRYDAANHPIPVRFNEWKKSKLAGSSSQCPYSGFNVSRAVTFQEHAASWKPGRALPALDLLQCLFEVFNIKWNVMKKGKSNDV
jgi:hypothetical protein